MITRISYGNWEGHATVLVYHDSGRMDGYEHQNGAWVSVHPADVATNATVINRERFDAMFPDISMPDLMK